MPDNPLSNEGQLYQTLISLVGEVVETHERLENLMDSMHDTIEKNQKLLYGDGSDIIGLSEKLRNIEACNKSLEKSLDSYKDYIRTKFVEERMEIMREVKQHNETTTEKINNNTKVLWWLVGLFGTGLVGLLTRMLGEVMMKGNH